MNDLFLTLQKVKEYYNYMNVLSLKLDFSTLKKIDLCTRLI